MATSGSVDLSLTVRQIVTHALQMISVCDAGETPAAEDAATALTTLELMLKTWGANPRLWLKTEATLALTASTASYSLAAARRVYSVRRRTSGIDTPLCEWSREEYFDYPNKASTGLPNSYYFDPQRATRTLYVWPVPDATIAASTTLRYTYARVIEDADSLNNDPDVPQEWLDALTYGLAERLGPIFGVSGSPDFKRIADTAAGLFAYITADDDEDASVFISPGRH
jgi:hypothetical protein